MPLSLVWQRGWSLKPWDMAVAVVALCVQLILSWGFYISRPKRQSWIRSRMDLLDYAHDTDPNELAEDAFFLLLLLTFGIILPFGLYLHTPMSRFEMLLSVFWAVQLWRLFFLSPLHLILTGHSMDRGRALRTPFLCLITMLVLYICPNQLDPSRITPALLALFLLDIITMLTLGRIINNKIKNRRA